MNEIAKYLLDSGAVHLKENPDEYFTWTSGKRSPIYCDNRMLISHPEYRTKIVDQFTEAIKSEFSDVEIIAGTATAGIPWAAWISDRLNLPMVYIRSQAKSHGLKSAIEGQYTPKQKVLIIEDLISTGKSSIAAFEEANAVGLETQGILSIFSYSTTQAKNSFQKKKIKTHSLCNLDQLLEYSTSNSFISSQASLDIQEFRNKL